MLTVLGSLRARLPHAADLGSISSFYFERGDDFREVREFVHHTDTRYGLHMEYLDNNDFKAGLEEYLTRHNTLAIILGTRRGDPNAEGQEYFCPSSDGWPPFMRINPILDWTYHDVWTFLRATNVPYCSLYDAGYTSLGGTHNTLPNSALKKEDGSFAPAYMLADGRLERVGRATKARHQDSLPSSPADVASSISGSAGIVVVGDEILSGKVIDANAPFLCTELRALGWTVRTVVIVPDDVSSIAAEVSRLSGSLDVVLTSGGVGPTLDDVTMEAIAAAFGSNLIRCGRLLLTGTGSVLHVSPGDKAFLHMGQPVLELTKASSPLTRLLVTLEGKQGTTLDAALSRLQELLPPHANNPSEPRLVQHCNMLH
eukprot:jgi/Chrzof1/13529/Cz08g00340.t1